MSHLDTYKFYLKKDAVTFYKSDSGIVSTTAIATPLKFSPDGWNKILIKWLRNTKYLGIGRTVTTPLRFVRDGAEILRKVYYTEGVEGVCAIEIWKRNNSDWTYSKYYSCAVDFSKAIDKYSFFQVNFLDNEVESKIKANESVPYEIDCNRATTPSVRMIGITLTNSYKFLTLATSTMTRGLLACTEPIVEGDYPVVIEGSQRALSVPTPLEMVGNFWDISRYNENQYLITVRQDGKFIVDFKQSFRVVAVDPCRITFVVMVIQENRMVRDAYTLYQENFAGGATYLRNAVGPTSFPMPGYVDVFKGERICFGILLSPTTLGTSYSLEYFGNDDYTVDAQNWVNVSFKFKLAETFAPAIYYHKFFDLLMQKVLGSTATVSYSSLLRSSTPQEDNVPYYNQVTCGDALRGFEIAKIRTTLSDTFQDASTRHCGGLGFDPVTGRVVFEHLSYFLNKDIIIADLGDVSEMEISPASEWMGNAINIGQENQEYDELNGREEYNQMMTFKFPIVRLNNTIDWVSKFRFDMYGIETYRANLTQKKTTDSASDNDTFVLSTEPDTFSYDKLRRPKLTSGGTVSGVPDPVGAYNIDLSPKRNLLRNKARIAAITYLRNTESLTFQTTDKNANLQAKWDSSRPLIVEKANVAVSSLGTPLYLPFIFKFKTQSPMNLVVLMNSFSTGCFRFRYKGNLYKGYPLDVGIYPSDNDTYEFELLSTQDNDINKLISA